MGYLYETNNWNNYDEHKSFDENKQNDAIVVKEKMDNIENGIYANSVDLYATQSYYEGVDLTVKFSDEISQYTNAFAWIKARCKAKNWKGLHVGDYIPLRFSTGIIYNMQIAGIDTYYSPDITAGGAWTGNPNKYHMIDFVADKAYGLVKWNLTQNNNGTSTEPYSYRASNLYNVLNGTVYNQIPQDVRELIAVKYLPITKKYNSSYVLYNPSNSDNVPIGKIWTLCLDEIGASHFTNSDIRCNGLYYPLMGRPDRRVLKFAGYSFSANYIWLIDTKYNDTTGAYWVDKYTSKCTGGYFTDFNACSYVGFRIQGD